jgi:formate hydrogenlyase transcriptional activator
VVSSPVESQVRRKHGCDGSTANIAGSSFAPCRSETSRAPSFDGMERIRILGTSSERKSDIRETTLEQFQAYDWPGNIRELQNVIERAVVLCDSEIFSVDETWRMRESPQHSGPDVPFATTLVEHEREIIEAALAACRGRISGPSGAAAKLGIPRQTLDSKIKNLGINKHRFKARQAD